MKRTIAVMAVFFMMSIASGAGGNIDNAEDYLRRNVVTVKLSNGITVVLLDRGYAPTLAFDLSFSVGSSDESYNTVGAAHLLEHMLFKGTDRIGTTDYARESEIQKKIEAVGETIDRLRASSPGNVMLPELESRLKKLQDEQSKYVVSSPYDRIYSERGGIGFNASTSRDRTGYYVELPASELELWASLESERLRKPVFREYYLERNNVMQERLMRYDSSGEGLLEEKFMATAFEAHPYRHPIIGWRTGIGSLSIRDVRAFYYAHYVPSRMVITIVGRQNTAETLAVIKKYFEGIEARPEPVRFVAAEPEKRGEKRFAVAFDANPLVMIGWHKPTFPSKDDYVCDVVAELLAGGKSSPLYRSIVIEKQLASSLSAWNGYPAARYDNLFVIEAAPVPAVRIGDLEAQIYAGIESAARNVSAEDLARVVNKMESDLVFGLATNKGLAGMLGYYQSVFGKWQYVTDYMKAIRSVTQEDVRAAIKKYFTKENRTVGILERREGERNEEK